MVLFSNSSWKVRVMPKVFKMFICSFIIWMDWPPSSMKFLVVSHPWGRFLLLFLVHILTHW